MIVSVKINDKEATIDLSKPIDLSLVSKTKKSFKAWYSKEIEFSTIREGDFVGSVKEGGAVNFKEIIINPHANMTHTESVGHIALEEVPVNKMLRPFHFVAQLISIKPKIVKKDYGDFKKGDQRVVLTQLKNKILPYTSALILRTQSTYSHLAEKEFSNTNWPYLTEETAAYIRKMGVRHLLIDQPSVDKEVDGGKLLAHRAFWNYPDSIDQERTITELIGVPSAIEDGIYLLNLSISNIENDASPSRPIIYKPNF
jgi:kynurenine formamidase